MDKVKVLIVDDHALVREGLTKILSTDESIKIALTIHDQEEYLFELIKAGISGYILKDISPSLLIQTIQGVARGESFITPSMTAKMFSEYARLSLTLPNSCRHQETQIPAHFASFCDHAMSFSFNGAI